MALIIGSEHADAGMSQAIYQELDKQFSPPFAEAVEKATGETREKAEQALEGARKSWQKLSFCIAQGVINHLINNMEISGIQASGNVNAVVQDQKAIQNNLVFSQSNNGRGHIQ